MIRKREGKHKIYKPSVGTKLELVVKNIERKNGSKAIKIYAYNPITKRWKRLAAIPTCQLKAIYFVSEYRGKEKERKIKINRS